MTRLAALAQIAAMMRDRSLASIGTVSARIAQVQASVAELDADLAEQAGIARSSGEMLLHHTLQLYARHCDTQRIALSERIRQLEGTREQLRTEAAQYFGRALALDRLARQARDKQRHARAESHRHLDGGCT